MSNEKIWWRKKKWKRIIILDGRFITVGENNWDLRSRHTFSEVHIDMNDIYAEEEDVPEEPEEDVDSTIEDDYN